MFARGPRTPNQTARRGVAPPVSRSWFTAFDTWIAARAVWLLALGVALYAVVFTAAAWYKYATYRMGFDLAAHEQVLWNTIHGRIAASSPHAGTASYFGIDIIVIELLVAPLYALVPSAYAILALQALVVGLGALPVYAIARTRLNSPLAGLAFAAAYLLYAPVEWMTLYEFQIRAFATTFLLCALFAFERRRPLPFLLWSLLALGCRADCGLVVAGMGVYAWLEGRTTKDEGRRAKGEGQKTEDQRRRTKGESQQTWSFVVFTVVPIVAGLGWLLLCTLVLVPLFRDGNQSLYIGVIYGELAQRCGKLPFVAAMHPICVAQYVFAPGDGRGVLRMRYLLEMFLPFAFLPLLAPRALLPAVPIFAINLLSNTPNLHASTHYHYQALIIPFMLVASIKALAQVLDERRTTNDERRKTKDEESISNLSILSSTPNSQLLSPISRPAAAIVLLTLALACNLGFRNPFFSLLTQPVDRTHIAVAERIMARVPADASLAASYLLAPHLANRQGLYVFPGDDIIYPTAYFWRADYLLIDTSSFDTRGHDAGFFATMRASGQYALVTEEAGVSLWRRNGVARYEQ